MSKKYTFNEVVEASIKYFQGDQLAAEVFANKYALKNAKGEYDELTPDFLHRRLAREFARIEEKFGGPRMLTEQQIYDLFANFKYVVPQGSPMAAIGNKYSAMSASNCTVIAAPDDSMGSIMKRATEMAQLLKRRCGVGIDLSKLRPHNAVVHNAALASSGAYSFADFYSYVGRMIGQKGRQGAEMITMHISHPDAPLFATMKHDKTRVTGANISLRITDDFMKAVVGQKKFTLQWPVEGKPVVQTEIEAEKLFDVIVESAYKTGDPGLLMWDNIVNNLPAHCYPEFRTSSTNPCAEIALSPYDSCRLISINLAGYVNKSFEADASFDFTLFTQHVASAQRLSDDLVELELELILRIRNGCIDKAEKKLWHKMYEAARLGRRTGLGTHGLGDCFARLGHRYDSDMAHTVAHQIYSILRNTAYATSISLADERGAFPLWKWDVEKKCDFFRRLPADILVAMKKYGRRNIALLTNAPTGSVALMSRTTSGVEPIFRLNYTRRVKVHNNPKITVDYTDEMGEQWHHCQVAHPAWHEYCSGRHVPPEDVVVPDCFATSDVLNYEKNVELIGIIQSYIDHGVSCTINMPQSATLQMVKDVYIKAWQSGLKGVTVYVAGSKDGVLVVTEDGHRIQYTRAPKRPLDIPCDIHITTCSGKRWLVIVGFIDDKPYEVFAGRASDLPMPREVTKATIRKMGSHQYSIVYKEEGEEVFVPIKESFVEDNGMLVRLLINQGLRHGVPLETLYDTITKATDITAFSRTVVRILKLYIDKESQYRVKCFNCGSHDMRLVDGCWQCNVCSLSKCG